MYTSYIGKKFLKLYNEREGTQLSAREFFDQIFFPLFFDDPRHLLHVGNSAFFQKPSKKVLLSGISIAEAQLEKLHQDIANEPPNMATFVGYGAKDMTGTTSGQLTNLNPEIDAEEMFASWLGQALGVGVSGGFVMLIDLPEILLCLADGWKYYRKYLNQTPNVKGRQIETWNGQWLCHLFSSQYDSDYPLDNFEVEISEVQGKLSIPTIEWSKVLFALSRKLEAIEKPKDFLTTYSYNLSQTNTTLGFINLYLLSVKTMYEIRDKVFLNKESFILRDDEIEKLSPFFNFREACMFGTIGLKSLEPRGLRKYMPKGSYKYAQGKDFKFSDESSFQMFNLFKLWIIAMLNKTELLDLAAKLAQSLLNGERVKQPMNRGKSTVTRSSQELLETKNIRTFIEKLTALIESDNADLFKELVNQVLKMPADNFPLFITLVRFEYQYQQHNN